ncbi:unnamed protein product, partial [Rotaria sp. Silwood1]
TTSSRMKITFILLCILFCIISLVLYSNTSLNWTLLNSIIANSLISISHSSQNIIIYPLLNKTDKINLTDKINQTKTILLPPSENRRFAVFACSIHSTILAYTFYTPIAAASWKRVGYETIAIFVGDFTKPNVLTGRLNLSRNYLKHMGGHIVDIQCNESYSVKLSQLVRVFSGFLPDSIVQDEDNILTGDSDLIPLKASEYKPTPGTNGFIFNAFCCGTFQRRGKTYTMFPMGHIFLQKKAWRAIIMESVQRSELLINADNHTQYLLSEYAPLSFNTISLYGRHEFKTIFDQRMDKGDSAWYMDQVLCSMLLTDYRKNHSKFNISERGHIERLDRTYPMSYWNRDDFNQFGDSHLKHDDILEEGNWKIFNKLLKNLFNDTLVTLLNDYYKQYMIIDKILVNQTKL